MNRDAVSVAAGLFAVAYGTNVSTPFLVLYKDRLELGDSATMAIFVVYVAGILSTLLVIGPISDRLGRKPIVVPFVALSAVASLCLLVGRDAFVFLLLGRLLLGVVSGAVLGIASAWLQELLGRGQEQRAAVLTTVVSYAGFGLGPIVSALIAETIGSPLTVPFVVHIVLTVAVIPLVLAVPDHRPAGEPRPLRIEFGVPTHARRTFFGLVAPAAIWVFAFASVSFALFPVIILDGATGASRVLVAGAVGMITALPGVLARPLVARIGAAVALPTSMVVGIVGYGFGLAALSTGSWPLILPAAALLGTASGALTAGSLTVLGQVADDATRGSLTSTFYLLAYPGMAMPLLLTSLTVVFPLEVGVAVAIGFATVCAIVAGRGARTFSGSAVRMVSTRSS